MVTGEFEVDICGLAVPITSNGRTMAVLGTSFPTKTPKFEESIENTLNQLRSAARQLSALRFFREGYA